MELGRFMEQSLAVNGAWYQPASFLNAEPGTVREYSNIGAALCALVIASATQQDYRAFTQEHILKPLQMEHSGWTSAHNDPQTRSRLFARKDKLIARYELVTYADGGFITSSNDLGLFLSELIRGYNGNGKLLTKASYERLFAQRGSVDDSAVERYGLFMEFRDGFLHAGHALVGHNGSDPGVFTALYFDPATRIGKIVLVNTDTDFDDQVWPAIETIWRAMADQERSLLEKP